MANKWALITDIPEDFILDDIDTFYEIRPVVCPIIVSEKEHNVKSCICCNNMPRYRQILQTHVKLIVPQTALALWGSYLFS